MGQRRRFIIQPGSKGEGFGVETDKPACWSLEVLVAGLGPYSSMCEPQALVFWKWLETVNLGASAGQNPQCHKIFRWFTWHFWGGHPYSMRSSWARGRTCTTAVTVLDPEPLCHQGTLIHLTFKVQPRSVCLVTDMPTPMFKIWQPHIHLWTWSITCFSLP